MQDAPQEIRTFFITSVTNARRPIFRSDRSARLLLDVLKENREAARFLVHEFVVMPDHFHLIITPAENVSLEKAAQYIKGGFSFLAKRELNYATLIWEESFTNHRVHDEEDYARHREYIHQNPVEARLVQKASDYPYSSAFPGAAIDPVPPWLKPRS
jgi:putative transposase